jgi:hypothetical protein
MHLVNTELSVVLGMTLGLSDPIFLDEYAQSIISEAFAKYIENIPVIPLKIKPKIIKKFMKYNIDFIEENKALIGLK